MYRTERQQQQVYLQLLGGRVTVEWPGLETQPGGETDYMLMYVPQHYPTHAGMRLSALGLTLAKYMYMYYATPHFS